MKTLPLIALAALLLFSAGWIGYSNRTARPQWQYLSFRYEDWPADRSQPEQNHKRWETVVIVDSPPLSGDRFRQTNVCHGADSVMNTLGKSGWELSCCDGKDYVMKRQKTDGYQYSISHELLDISQP